MPFEELKTKQNHSEEMFRKETRIPQFLFEPPLYSLNEWKYSASIEKNPIGNWFIEKKVNLFCIHKKNLTWALTEK